MTDFRAWGTIMGPAGLTAVFEMGTGRAPPVWSPGSRLTGLFDRAAGAGRSGVLPHKVRVQDVVRCERVRLGPTRTLNGCSGRVEVRARGRLGGPYAPGVSQGFEGPRVGVVKPLGC